MKNEFDELRRKKRKRILPNLTAFKKGGRGGGRGGGGRGGGGRGGRGIYEEEGGLRPFSKLRSLREATFYPRLANFLVIYGSVGHEGAIWRRRW